MAFVYPFNKANGSEFGDYTEFESALKAETIGQFGFNPNNNSWHGGVHFTHNNAAHLKDDMPVVAIADGKVVACRINDKYQTSTFKGETLTYSQDFCLIQHDVLNPDNNSDRFTFYSLYMHLAPLGYPHRQVTQRPQKKVLKKYQAYSEPNVDGEAFALLPGTIVESQSDTLEHHGDHYFQSYRIVRADDLALQNKTIWLVTHQDTTPPDVSHQFLEQTLFTPNAYTTAPVECLGLNRELRVRYSPSMDAPYFSLRQNSKVKLLNDEPVRDGNFILKAYEIVYNSNASVKEIRQGDKVWMPVAKYSEKQAIDQEGMEAYSPPDWVLTKVVAKTIREGLAGRAEPYLKNGVLQAGNVAYRIPEGTVLGYKRSENCNVQMINGKSHLMALCRVSSDTPVINTSGQKMTSAWVCVEDEFVEKQTVYSLDLGKPHCFGNSSSLHVKAGEAIGYLGRYDAATIGEEPPYTTRHQVHFELFSTEKPPQFFIDLFFGVSEEQPEITFIEDTSNCDGYFDRDEPSGFFQQFNDDPQEGGDPVTSILKRLKPWDGGKSIIAKHESEWSLASSEKPFFDKLVQKYQDPDFAELIEHEKTRLDDLIWLPDVGSLGITKDMWNWWPIKNKNIIGNDLTNDSIYQNTKIFPDNNLRSMLEETNQDILFTTLAETYELLQSWGWNDTKTKWVEITGSSGGQVIVNYTANGKDIVTTSMIISKLGSFGIKATIYTNHLGTELIKFTGYAGIRKILNAPVFGTKNPKVVDVGIGKYGLKNSIISGARFTFYFAAAFRTVDFILNDETTLATFIGSLATDVVKIGIASLITLGLGTVLVTPFVVANLAVVVVVGLVASIGLNYLDNKFGITNQVVEYIEMAQQEAIEKAREVEDGFLDISAMLLAGLLDSGREFLEDEIKIYIKKTLKDITPRFF